jgi:cAMP-binding proteins - catabolite gene activator and regulatory subunit of cAMP-dependent protein kinases
MENSELQTIFSALQTGPFADMSETGRQKLAHHARLQPFGQGATLFREGEPSTDPMLLLTGMIKICRHSSQGKECVLHLVRPGRLLDAGVLFYEEGLPVTALGVQAGTVLRLDRKALLEALQHEAALGLALLTAMSLRQRLFINKIAGSQGRISVSGRVAAWLLHRAKMEKSATLDMGVTQETLARQMGISRESLSRELSALASAGLIDRNRRRITLLDADALRGRAEG